MKILKLIPLVLLVTRPGWAEPAFPEDGSVFKANNPKVLWVEGLDKAPGPVWTIDVDEDWTYKVMNSSANKAGGAFEQNDQKAWGCYAETCDVATRNNKANAFGAWANTTEWSLVGTTTPPAGPWIPGNAKNATGAVQWPFAGAFATTQGQRFWAHGQAASNAQTPVDMASACARMCADARMVPRTREGRLEMIFNPPPPGSPPQLRSNPLKKVRFPNGTAANPIRCRMGWNWEDFL